MLKASFLTNKLFDKGEAISFLSFLFRSHTQNASFPSKSIPYRKLYSRIDFGICSLMLLKSLVTKKHDSLSDMLKYLNISIFSHNNNLINV